MTHKDKNVEITLHQRPNLQGSVDLVRIDQVYHDMPLECFLEMAFKDAKPDHAKEYRDLGVSEDGESQILYFRAKIPFMSEREVIIRMKRENLDDGSAIVIMRSMAEHKDVPINPKYIRNEMMIARWIRPLKENPKHLEVIHFGLVDPKGYFPGRLFNMVIPSLMTKTVKTWHKKATAIKERWIKEGKIEN